MNPDAAFLPYGRQTIDDEDVSAVAAALRADLLTTGQLVGQFEERFAEAVGAAEAVACNSGTAALHLAALGLELGSGDAAVVPTLTFLATANVVRMTGAEVVFADVDPDTGLLTAESLEAALAHANAQGLNTKAAFPVHLNGQACDMPEIEQVATRSLVALVEDACHALGLAHAGATTHSSMACFSTHPVKAIATGEGGVVTTADTDLAERLRRLRSHGMTRDSGSFLNADMSRDGEQANPWYYEMHEIGWNYRIPDVLCALGLSQLGKLSGFHRRRGELASLYDELLSPQTPTVRPVPHGTRAHGWHLYAVLVDFETLGTTRARLMRSLREQGIGTQVHYIPVHHQPYYRARYGSLNLPGADAYYARCLSLPLFPSMSDDDVERVVTTLSRIVSGKAAA